MLKPEHKERYLRHILLEEIGEEGQLKLLNARVLVIGAGGLSCPALQYLASAGIGCIGIMDDDVVESSNLQRQTLYTEADIGRSKVEVASERLKAMNSTIEIHSIQERLHARNARDYFSRYDIIVEGSDSFITKYLVNDAAVLENRPFVLASIFKFEGQLSVYNFLGGPTYRCLFPEPVSPKNMPTCAEVGVLGVLPGILGAMQANEVLKIILGIGNVLSEKLLKMNILSMEQQLFSFRKDPGITVESVEEIKFSCETSNIKTMPYSEYLNNKERYQLLDVRTNAERSSFHIGGIHIPLKHINRNSLNSEATNPWLVYCQSGARSEKAIEILQKEYPEMQFFNLKNGLKDIY